MKIAAWSGPRNLSTAMLYAFGARPDCAAWDEPFYAPYLARSGADHPMRAEILAAHEPDPGAIAATCAGAPPPGHTHWYMKHMPHHMLPGFDMGWADNAVNIHLIRHPARVIASYAAKRDTLTLEDIGFAQQATVYDRLEGTVIDSEVIRANPRAALQALCAAIGLPWSDAMLAWPAGPKPFDGVWAAHWYGAVHRSTGFADPEGPLPEVAPAHRTVLDAALPFYEAMRARSIKLTKT
jgi:hypothetical protein